MQYILPTFSKGRFAFTFPKGRIIFRKTRTQTLKIECAQSWLLQSPTLDLALQLLKH
jgi:hypothetical protein